MVLRALEHDVLEQVGKPSLTALFVLGADVVPDVYGGNRQRPVGDRITSRPLGSVTFVKSIEIIECSSHRRPVEGGFGLRGRRAANVNRVGADSSRIIAPPLYPLSAWS